jgi:DNA-binding beta-propeller fold protein YncE
VASLPLPQCASRAPLFLSNDKRNLYLTSIFQHLLLTMNADLSAAPRQSGLGEQPGFMACSPDGKWLYICDCLTNNLMFVDAQNGTVAHTVPLGNNPLQCVMTKDGHYLWIGYIHRRYATCVDLQTRKVVADVHNVLVHWVANCANLKVIKMERAGALRVS